MTSLFNISRSFVFENRDNQLIEIPVIEYIQLYKNNICRLIKYAVNPYNVFEDYKFTIEYEELEETILLSECNLDQAIKIAIMLEIDDVSMHYHPDYFTILSLDNKEYAFKIDIFDSQSENIKEAFAELIVKVNNLEPMNLVRMRLPEYPNCFIDEAILEIHANLKNKPKLVIIDKNHQNWQGYINYYFNTCKKIQLEKIYKQS